jgi:hypothetical protein
MSTWHSHIHKVIVSVVVKMEAILFHYSVIALYFYNLYQLYDKISYVWQSNFLKLLILSLL